MTAPDREALLAEADRLVLERQEEAARRVTAALGPSPAAKLQAWLAAEAAARAHRCPTR